MSKGLFFALMLVTTAGPVAAQTDSLTPRVTKLEKELRAVQRKVFPGETILEPEIRADAPVTQAPGSQASSPIADLTARVDSLEGQLAQITGQAEQNAYRLRQLEEQVKSLSDQADNRLKALESGAPAGGDASPPPVRPTNSVDDAPRGADRKAAVAAVARPSTSDEADDRYVFGYRLWQAKLYPEAETEFKAVVSKYPKHRRANFAQNLLGRAYLDEGKPALASVAFYDNYQKYPQGERSPESLAWLGTALIQLKKQPEACKVYDELQDVYGATLTATIRSMVADGRKRAKCG